jgi:hypothetical protein
MEQVIRRIDLTRVQDEEARRLLRREWLVTNFVAPVLSP